jgi:DNA polymerase-3 subunit delta'
MRDSAMTLLPWHEPLWRKFAESMVQSRFPQATILAGPEGVGRGHLAKWLARAVLCLARDEAGMPCGHCASCRQYDAESHPDLLLLAPADEGKPIVIDQIRAFSQRLFLTPHHGHGRVGIVNPLDAMNANAANGFLKTLEEPPSGVHLIMVCQRLLSIPATIRSRCQIVHIHRPPEDVALDWLKAQEPDMDPALLAQTGGAPLKALALSGTNYLQRARQWSSDLQALLMGRTDPLTLSEKWKKASLAECIDWLHACLADLFKLKLGLPGRYLAHADNTRMLLGSTQNITWCQLRRIHAETMEARRLIDTQVNSQLLLDSLLVSWSGVIKGS